MGAAKRDAISPASVRTALASARAPDGAPLVAADEVAEIVVEGGWAAVALHREGVSREWLTRVHGHLARSLPGAEIELRVDGRVYRGGAGFGEGKHVVAVLGGKGGVGKSTLAVNLALTFSAMGLRVGLLDGDLNAPDVPHLLGVHAKVPPRGYGWQLSSPKVTPPSERRRPQERFGVEVMSVGFIVPEGAPLLVTTRLLASQLLRYLLFDVAWRADVLLIDAPPGTGQELQVMAGELPLSGAIFVTTPQDLAQMDAERTLALLTQHGVPVAGLVQNMASMTCPHCGEEIDMFARSRRLADAGVPVLGRIPFDVRLSTAADQGRPLVLGDPAGPIAYEFARIGSAVRRWLAERDGAGAAA
ncbi:MAG: P-loop NTPase [Chloroflexi bacterium]|nr:P-loop NTPase [Chloroflexota bacterium]